MIGWKKYLEVVFSLPVANALLQFQCNFERVARRVNPLSANPTKWSNTRKQYVGNFPTNCLSVFDHFVSWRLNG